MAAESLEPLAALAGGLASLLGGWVLLCLAWRLLAGPRRLLCALLGGAASREGGAAAATEPLLPSGAERSARAYVHRCLEGQNAAGRLLRRALLALIAASVAAFLLGTRKEVSEAQRGLLEAVEAATALLFGLEFLARLWVCTEKFEAGHGSVSARLRWLLGDPYALLDLVSLLPFYLELLSDPEDEERRALPRLNLLRLLRALQLLEDAGAGLEVFVGVLAARSQVLLASSFVGASVWLVCSTLYYHFERGNPAMLFCPLCSDPEDPSSCRGKGQKASCYGRMDSIPSASYYCLVNLFGEFPLMTEHSVGGRCVGIFIAVVGNAMAGIAMGVIGNGFSDYVSKLKEAAEEAANAEEPGGAYAALSGGEEEQPPVARRRSRTVSSVPLLAALDSPHGAWRGVCGALCLGGWALYLLVGHESADRSVLDRLDDSSPFRDFKSGGDLHLGKVGQAALAICLPFEALSAVLFFGEYAVRLAAERRDLGAGYAASALGVADFLSFAPALLAPALPEWWLPALYPLLCLARSLKLERYLGAFRALGGVLEGCSPVLATTGAVALALWCAFATLMWLSEASNPVEETRSYYESVPAAMWITMLNLSGECPLADYTIAGKLITGCIGVFAVSVFSVPFGLMSDGFQEFLDEDEFGQDEQQSKEQQARLDRVTRLPSRPCPGRPGAVLAFLQGSRDPQAGPWSLAFEWGNIIAIVGSVALTLLESLYGGFGAETDFLKPDWLHGAELAAVLWFSLDAGLRCYAAPADPRYGSRCAYLFSFYGFVDALTVLPYFASKLAPEGDLRRWADHYDEELRLCRLLRLLLLGEYVPSLGLIRRVLQDPGIRQDLKVALYVAGSCWLLFSTLLHLSEAWDSSAHPDMAWRFRSVLSSMPFTLIHLTGDYPLVEYTLPARFVHVLMIISAQGLVGVAGGIIASGFTRELQAMRERERERRRKATKVLGRAVREWLTYRRWMKVLKLLRQQQQRSRSLAQLATERTGVMKQLGQAVHGRRCAALRMVLVLLNVVSLMLQSVEDIRQAWGEEFFADVEFAFICTFTVDYLLKLYTAPVVADFAFLRRMYAFSFFGVVELLSVLPYWLELLLGLGGVNVSLFLYKVAPSFRVLQLEQFVQAFTLLDDAWQNCKDVVKTSGLLAALVWVFGAVLFYEAEKDNVALDGALSTLPSALHFTAIFLGGEWALVDFTPLGKLLCSFYCLLGIAVFAIPVGSFFEAFEAAMTGDEEE